MTSSPIACLSLANNEVRLFEPTTKDLIICTRNHAGCQGERGAYYLYSNSGVLPRHSRTLQGSCRLRKPPGPFNVGVVPAPPDGAEASIVVPGRGEALQRDRCALQRGSVPDCAETRIVPGLPARVRTTTSAGPLNALRSGAGKRSKLVGSPLSVATISPGPSIVNFMWSFAPGAIMPAASVAWTVMKERSMPSARTFERSADRASFAGASAVLTVSVAHSLPFLQTTTFNSPGW